MGKWYNYQEDSFKRNENDCQEKKIAKKAKEAGKEQSPLHTSCKWLACEH